MKNIFVGNLSFNTSEDELRQMFAPFGQVDRVSIMTDRDTGRSRGFGFVEMASNEDGDKAITALNGSQVDEKTPKPISRMASSYIQRQQDPASPLGSRRYATPGACTFFR